MVFFEEQRDEILSFASLGIDYESSDYSTALVEWSLARWCRNKPLALSPVCWICINFTDEHREENVKNFFKKCPVMFGKTEDEEREPWHVKKAVEECCTKVVTRTRVTLPGDMTWLDSEFTMTYPFLD